MEEKKVIDVQDAQEEQTELEYIDVLIPRTNKTYKVRRPLMSS